jgi:hypothetical protein
MPWATGELQTYKTPGLRWLLPWSGLLVAPANWIFTESKTCLWEDWYCKMIDQERENWENKTSRFYQRQRYCGVANVGSILSMTPLIEIKPKQPLERWHGRWGRWPRRTGIGACLEAPQIRLGDSQGREEDRP